jgi:colanic acid/amylovoran biosynthesis protein
MKKIVISNCWSFYNKGDASIAIATTDLINDIFDEPKITLLAVDHQSFIDHKDSFVNPPQIQPMIHTIFPFNKIRFIYSAILHVSKKYLPIVGLAYLIFQLAAVMLFRHINRKVDLVLSEIDQADLIIGVGGNYLWSHEGFYNHLLPLIYGKLIKKKKLALLGQSIGPFNDGVDKIVAKRFLEEVDLIIFREDVSHNYINSNIYKTNNGIISSDYAFLLPQSSYQKQKEKTVGITIRPWLRNQPHLFEKYIDSIIKLIEDLTGKGYMIYLLPFSYLPGLENDIVVCDQVLNSLSIKARDRVQKISLRNLSPSEIIDKLDQLSISIMVGTRMHSAILASIANIPPIIISYQHFKALGISKQLNIQDYVIKIDEINYDKLSHNFNELSREIDEKVDEIQKSLTAIRSDLYNKTEENMIQLTK